MRYHIRVDRTRNPSPGPGETKAEVHVLLGGLVAATRLTMNNPVAVFRVDAVYAGRLTINAKHRRRSIENRVPDIEYRPGDGRSAKEHK